MLGCRLIADLWGEAEEGKDVAIVLCFRFGVGVLHSGCCYPIHFLGHPVSNIHISHVMLSQLATNVKSLVSRINKQYLCFGSIYFFVVVWDSPFGITSMARGSRNTIEVLRRIQCSSTLCYMVSNSFAVYCPLLFQKQ